MYRLLLGISLAAIPFLGFSGIPALAADASMGTPDCSKAPAMMMQKMAPSPEAMMTGDHAMSVDAAYLKSMKSMLDHESTMAKMEVACGSSVTVKADAKKALSEMQPHVDEVQRLLQSIAL